MGRLTPPETRCEAKVWRRSCRRTLPRTAAVRTSSQNFLMPMTGLPGALPGKTKWLLSLAMILMSRTLCCDDVTGREGVDLILVRPDDEGRKRLKSRAARRMVPVHPTLKKLGLLVFVERQRAAGHKVLFPKLKVDRRGYYSDGYQKWFARLLKKANAKAPRTTFHSTRHNFRDQLREIEAPREVTLALGGWAGNGGTADDYGGGLKPKTLLRWVKKIEYPDLVLPAVTVSSA